VQVEKKNLYRVKQAPHAWYSRIYEYLLSLCFTKTSSNPNLYYLFDRFDLLVLILYVDDLILTRISEKVVERYNVDLAREFKMKDIGLMHYFLGLEVWQSPSEVSFK
jgi:hypothetical protein